MRILQQQQSSTAEQHHGRDPAAAIASRTRSVLDPGHGIAHPDIRIYLVGPMKEKAMRVALLALLLPLALGGCVSFSSSDPPPPNSNTVVVPSH